MKGLQKKKLFTWRTKHYHRSTTLTITLNWKLSNNMCPDFKRSKVHVSVSSAQTCQEQAELLIGVLLKAAAKFSLFCFHLCGACERQSSGFQTPESL